MSEAQITLEAFLAGFEEEIKHHLFYLGAMYGDDAVARLIDIPDNNLLSPEGPQIDLSDTHLGVNARWLYQYAVEGVLYQGVDVPHREDAIRVIDLLCITNVECNGNVDPAVECVWRKAIARARFDNQRWELDLVSEDIETVWAAGSMTIEDVAWLCDMSIASVRNSTTAKAKDPLKTFREDGKVFVDPASLVDWLSRRRGYQATRIIGLKEAENESFTTLDELQQFVGSRMRNLKISAEAVIEATGLKPTDVLRLQVGGKFPKDCWEIDTVIGLTKALDLADSSFIPRATAVVLEHKLKMAGLTPKAEVVPFRPKNGTGRSK